MYSAKKYDKSIPHLSLISRLAKENNNHIWLVGGFLRDFCLKKHAACFDFDFALNKNSRAFAKGFAREISSKCITLDEPRQTFRVIFKSGEKIYTYDFSRLAGKTIKDDLSLRDFTINSLALDLREKNPEIIDYFSGRKDIKNKLIRVVNNRVIADDPLRILRAFAFSLKFSFRICPDTLKLIAKQRKLIAKVSAERINQELFKIFSRPDSYSVLRIMDKLKIIDEVIPYISPMRGVRQGGYHHLEVWQHSLETLRQFEWLLAKKILKDRDIMAYLNKEVAAGHKTAEVIKLACLLHDVGKPSAKRKLNKRTIFHTHEKIGRDLAELACKKLRISAKEINLIKNLIFWHLRPGYLADQISPSRRAVYRFFRDCGDEGPGVILLSLSDWRATRGPLTNSRKRARHEKIMLNLLDEHLRQIKKKPPVLLLDGYAIMKKFKLKPGILIGKILTKLKEEQALGKLKTKSQAYALAKKIINETE